MVWSRGMPICRQLCLQVTALDHLACSLALVLYKGWRGVYQTPTPLQDVELAGGAVKWARGKEENGPQHRLHNRQRYPLTNVQSVQSFPILSTAIHIVIRPCIAPRRSW